MDDQKNIGKPDGQAVAPEAEAAGTDTRADYVGYLIGDVSRMIRTVYDRGLFNVALLEQQCAQRVAWWLHP